MKALKELLKDFLAQTACKAAVKAGDKLSDEDIDALLKQFYHYKPSKNVTVSLKMPVQ